MVVLKGRGGRLLRLRTFLRPDSFADSFINSLIRNQVRFGPGRDAVQDLGLSHDNFGVLRRRRPKGEGVPSISRRTILPNVASVVPFLRQDQRDEINILIIFFEGTLNALSGGLLGLLDRHRRFRTIGDGHVWDNRVRIGIGFGFSGDQRFGQGLFVNAVFVNAVFVIWRRLIRPFFDLGRINVDHGRPGLKVRLGVLQAIRIQYFRDLHLFGHIRCQECRFRERRAVITGLGILLRRRSLYRSGLVYKFRLHELGGNTVRLATLGFADGRLGQCWDRIGRVPVIGTLLRRRRIILVLGR